MLFDGEICNDVLRIGGGLVGLSCLLLLLPPPPLLSSVARLSDDGSPLEMLPDKGSLVDRKG